jgi:hypothetical protein
VIERLAACALVAALMSGAACKGGDATSHAPVRVDKAIARVTVSLTLSAGEDPDRSVAVLQRRFDALKDLDGAALLSLDVRRDGDKIALDAVLEGGASCAQAPKDALLALVTGHATRSGHLAFHLGASPDRRRALSEALLTLPGVERVEAAAGVGAAAVDVPDLAPDALAPKLDALAAPPGFRALLERVAWGPPGRGGPGPPVSAVSRVWLVTAAPDIEGSDLASAGVAVDAMTNEPQVTLQFTAEGGRRFADLTGMAVKRYLAIVFEGEIQSAPVIRERIGGGRAVITLGGGPGGSAAKLQEAREIAAVLSAGPLGAGVALGGATSKCVDP